VRPSPVGSLATFYFTGAVNNNPVADVESGVFHRLVILLILHKQTADSIGHLIDCAFFCPIAVRVPLAGSSSTGKLNPDLLQNPPCKPTAIKEQCA
jgi:hypothetical protein